MTCNHLNTPVPESGEMASIRPQDLDQQHKTARFYNRKTRRMGVSRSASD